MIYGPNEQGQYFAASRGRTIREQFEAFHAKRPEVYDELVKVARQVRARRAHWSIGAAFEVVRYYRMIAPDEGEPFILNNNYRSYYARLIMANEPDLAGFFARDSSRRIVPLSAGSTSDRHPSAGLGERPDDRRPARSARRAVHGRPAPSDDLVRRALGLAELAQQDGSDVVYAFVVRGNGPAARGALPLALRDVPERHAAPQQEGERMNDSLCERCYLRPPRPASWREIEKTIEQAPRSRFPLLAYGWAPYPDDDDHGTLYLEIAARTDAEFEDPGHEWLFGGVGRGESHGPFDWREVTTRAQGVRLRHLAEDGDLDVGERGRSGIWMR